MTDGGYTDSALSADGRFVAFASSAMNLVAEDSDGTLKSFVHDIETGTTWKISRPQGGEPLDGPSFGATLSADGSIAAFYSDASTLVADDENLAADVFVFNFADESTTRVSITSTGAEADQRSIFPTISADGNVIAFESLATNLVEGDTNSAPDVFVHDLSTGVTTRVSVSSTGTEGNSAAFAPDLSADGSIVTFYSYSTNLVSDDVNNVADVFVHDRTTGVTTRVSLSTREQQGNADSTYPAISADGNVVAFLSTATNLGGADQNAVSDVFVHNRSTGETVLVSQSTEGIQGDGACAAPELSADGQVVTFHSEAQNLVADDENGVADIFVHHMATATTQRVNLAVDNGEANAPSNLPSLSGNGASVVFFSDASNLVAEDTNESGDIFVVPVVGP